MRVAEVICEDPRCRARLGQRALPGPFWAQIHKVPLELIRGDLRLGCYRCKRVTRISVGEKLYQRHYSMTVVNGDGNILVWSRQGEHLLGYPRREMLGTHINRIVPPTGYHQMRAVIDKIRLTRTPWRGRVVRLARDGRLVPMELSLNPVWRGDDYKLEGMISFAEVLQEEV
jgi:PAS domain S-box-containing protein